MNYLIRKPVQCGQYIRLLNLPKGVVKIGEKVKLFKISEYTGQDSLTLTLKAIKEIQSVDAKNCAHIYIQKKDDLSSSDYVLVVKDEANDEANNETNNEANNEANSGGNV